MHSFEAPSITFIRHPKLLSVEFISFQFFSKILYNKRISAGRRRECKEYLETTHWLVCTVQYKGCALLLSVQGRSQTYLGLLHVPVFGTHTVHNVHCTLPFFLSLCPYWCRKIWRQNFKKVQLSFAPVSISTFLGRSLIIFSITILYRTRSELTNPWVFQRQ